MLLTLGTTRPTAVGAPGVKDGGTFKLTFQSGDFDYIDPALAYTGAAWTLLDASCVRLMGNPDKPAPEGLRLVPEAATAEPRRRSRSGSTLPTFVSKRVGCVVLRPTLDVTAVCLR